MSNSLVEIFKYLVTLPFMSICISRLVFDVVDELGIKLDGRRRWKGVFALAGIIVLLVILVRIFFVSQ